MDNELEQEITLEDVNKLMAVRIEKLTELQQAGKDPFNVTKCEITDFARKYQR